MMSVNWLIVTRTQTRTLSSSNEIHWWLQIVLVKLLGNLECQKDGERGALFICTPSVYFIFIWNLECRNYFRNMQFSGVFLFPSSEIIYFAPLINHPPVYLASNGMTQGTLQTDQLSSVSRIHPVFTRYTSKTTFHLHWKNELYVSFQTLQLWTIILKIS